MKRALSFLMMAAALTACGSSSPTSTEDDESAALTEARNYSPFIYSHVFRLYREKNVPGGYYEAFGTLTHYEDEPIHAHPVLKLYNSFKDFEADIPSERSEGRIFRFQDKESALPDLESEVEIMLPDSAYFYLVQSRRYFPETDTLPAAYGFRFELDQSNHSAGAKAAPALDLVRELIRPEHAVSSAEQKY